MIENQVGMTLDELAEHVGVPARTIRFYITEGLLPGPGSRGKAATYGEEHLVRLRLIRRLAERHVPLAEMRTRLGRLSLAEARALLADEEAHAADLERAAQAESPRDYLAGLLEGGRTSLPTAPKAPRTPPGKRGTSPKEPASKPPGGHGVREALGAYAVPSSSTPAATPRGEGWRRWVLAPGIELFAREDILAARQGLIERLLDVVSADGEPRER